VEAKGTTAPSIPATLLWISTFHWLFLKTVTISTRRGFSSGLTAWIKASFEPHEEGAYLTTI
jgi:hypothetical protein